MRASPGRATDIGAFPLLAALLAPDPRTVDFVYHFWRAYPRRTVRMVALLFAAGLAEGVGILTLLPVLDLAGGSDDAATTWVSGAILSNLRRLGVEPSLNSMIPLMVGMIAAKGLLRWFAMRDVGFTIARVATGLRLRMIRAIAQARWEYLVTRRTGQLASAINSETRRAAWSYKDGCSALADAIQILVYGVVLFVVSWKAAAFTLLVGGLVVVLLRGLIGLSREAGERQTATMQELVARLTELLPNVKAFKSMGRERQMTAILEREAEAYDGSERQAVIAYETMTSSREPLFALLFAAGLWIALVFAGMSATVVVAVAILAYRSMTALGDVQSKYQSLVVGQSGFWCVHRHIREAEAAAEPDTGARQAPPVRHSIRFQHVSFSYGSSRALGGMDFEIPAGSYLSVTGGSGAGKTTFVDLLTGLLRPGEGEILVDGVPLSEIRIDSWREQIGYVPQALLMLNATVRENVRLGDPKIRDADIDEALRNAGAADFVARLPRGPDEVVGERGARLSGGQAQRIMIARALARKPRLLILDEATSALDGAVEREILDTLDRLRGTMTIVVISHREAPHARADVEVEIADGSARLRRGSMPTASVVAEGG